MWVRGVLGDPARLPGRRNESSSEGHSWKHLIVLPSQSHRYKPASVSPPQPLLNVFTRAPLSVPFCYYKALSFDAWAIQKDIPLYFPTPLPSSHTKELINNITLPLSPGKGSPHYKTQRVHTVTLCEAVQDEAIKAGFFFPPKTKDTFCLRMLKAPSGSSHCCQQKYNSSRSGNMPGSTTSVSRVSTVQSQQPEEHSQALHIPPHLCFCC